MHITVTYMTRFTSLFQPQFRNSVKMKVSQKTQQHKMTRKMKQNSPCPKHCKHKDRSRRFMKTWDAHQIARWYECYVSVEPSADSSWQPPGTGAVLVRHRNVQPVNDVVGLDLFFLNTYEKHTLPAMNIVCWDTGLQRVIPMRDQSGKP